MPIALKLYTGLCIRNAESMLIRKFDEWPWANYDGDSPRHPNVIDPKYDLDRLYQLGVRTSRQVMTGIIKRFSSKLTNCLKLLPLNSSLEDVDLDSLRKPIITLYDIILNSKGAKLAAGTKLLYPFRPRLLPIIDKILDDYYWYAVSICDEPAFRRLEQADSWGQYLFEIMKLMQKDIISVRKQIDTLREEFAEKDFGNASRMRILESLIWYYYARQGGHYKNKK